MVYTLRANSIYPSSKWYIPFKQMVYTLRANSIYPSSKWYIPFGQIVYTLQANGIYLTSETEGTFAPKPSLLSSHELAPHEPSYKASGL